jgi:Leucine-rich repeat (LRR) protein
MKRNEIITWSESPYDALSRTNLEKLLYLRGLSCVKDCPRKKIIFQLLKDDSTQREKRLKEKEKDFIIIQSALRGYKQRIIFEKEKIVLKEIYQNIECEELTVKDRSLLQIPNIVSECVNLIELNFSKNLISLFPSFLTNLSELRILNLSYNCIEEIPYFVSEMSNLEVLNLR